jgi:hypothetical protein
VVNSYEGSNPPSVTKIKKTVVKTGDNELLLILCLWTKTTKKFSELVWIKVFFSWPKTWPAVLLSTAKLCIRVRKNRVFFCAMVYFNNIPVKNALKVGYVERQI